jgi:hypothetical protein
MSDIFDEARLELEAIKRARLIRVFAYIFVAISFCAILSTIVYQWHRNKQEKEIFAISDEFFAVLNKPSNGMPETNIEKLKKIAQKDNSSFAGLSMLILAKEYYNKKQYEDFILNLQSVINNQSFELALRDYARVNLMNYFISHNMLNEASNLSSNTDIKLSPYKNLLKLNMSIMFVKQNKNSEAIKVLKDIIADPEAQENLVKDASSVLYIIENAGKNA